MYYTIHSPFLSSALARVPENDMEAHKVMAHGLWLGGVSTFVFNLQINHRFLKIGGQ